MTKPKVLMKDIPKNGLFRRKENAQTLYVRNHYDRGTKSFSCSDYYDINREIFIKANKEVFAE